MLYTSSHPIQTHGSGMENGEKPARSPERAWCSEDRCNAPPPGCCSGNLTPIKKNCL